MRNLVAFCHTVVHQKENMKTLLLVVVIVFSGTMKAEAQAIETVDHWSTAEECLASVTSPYYYPSILKSQKLEKDEVVRGPAVGGCVEMSLPEKLNGRGFVRIEAGRKFVFNEKTGKILRLAECNNEVFSYVPFPIFSLTGMTGMTGQMGPQGIQGLPGKNGLRGEKGQDGKNGENPQTKKGGSKFKKWAIIGGIVGAGIGGAAWYYWRCPPVR